MCARVTLVALDILLKIENVAPSAATRMAQFSVNMLLETTSEPFVLRNKTSTICKYILNAKTDPNENVDMNFNVKQNRFGER